jgi:hypothetical protein
MIVEKMEPVDWVIVGGESGRNARPCNIDWIRSIVRQCEDYLVPCFVKQLGARVIDRNDRGFEGDNGPSGWPMDTEISDTIEPVQVDDLRADPGIGAQVVTFSLCILRGELAITAGSG